MKGYFMKDWKVVFCFFMVTCFNAMAAPKAINPSEINELISNGYGDIDHVDPFNGVLTIKHQDVFIRGNGGLDIVVNRNYSTQYLNPVAGPEDNSRVISADDRWIGMGYGWTLNVAPKLYIPGNAIDNNPRVDFSINKLCQKQAWHPARDSYEYLIVDLEGKTKKMFPAESGVANSLDNWRLSCEGENNSLLLQDPSGLAYQLTKVNKVYGSHGGSSSGEQTSMAVLIQAEKIYDKNGNWLKIEYENTLVKNIKSKEGAFVSFQYTNNKNGIARLASIETSLGVWKYSYAESTLSPYFYVPYYGYLSKVQRPDGQEYQFSYWDETSHPENHLAGGNPANDDAARSGRLKKMLLPEGGGISFDYSFERNYRAYLWPYQVPDNIHDFNSVFIPIIQESKVVKRVLDNVGEWIYQYKPATQKESGQYDVTTVISPNQIVKYKHIGINYFWRPDLNSLFSPPVQGAWKVGLLVEKKVGDNYTEEYEWDSILHNSNWYSMVTGEGTVGIADNPVRLPLLKNKNITINGIKSSTAYDYDQFGRIVKESEQGFGRKTRTVGYDADLIKRFVFNAVKRQVVSSPQQQDMFIEREFDIGTGRVLSENNNGVFTKFTRYPSGDISTKTDANQRVTYFNNYKRGIAQQEVWPVAEMDNIIISREVDDSGNIKSETDGREFTTRYTFDGINRPTGIYTPIHNPALITWGKDLKIESKGSDTKTTFFDGFGRAIKNEHNGVVIHSRFDSLGRKIFQSYPNSEKGESVEYDALNRPVKRTHGDGSWQRWDYERGAGNRVDETNERGFVIQRYYQSYGNPLDTQLIAVNSVDLPSANIVINRNLQNQITSVSQNGRTRSYEYDKHFFLKKRIDPEIGATTFGRDNLGNMISRQVGNLGVTRYEYDFQNRLKKVVYPNSAPANYEYDENSNILSMAVGSSLRHYTYDANNNLETERVGTGDKWLDSKYSYNANDARSSLTYPNGRVVQFDPDAFGRPTRIGEAVPGIWYHPNGVVQAMTYANGVAQTQTLDDRQWIKTIQVGRGGTGGCGGSPTPPANLSNKPEIIRQNDGNYIYVGNGYYDAQLVKLSYAMIPLDDDLIIPVPAIPANALSPAQLAQGLPLAGNSARDINGNLNPTPCNVAAGGTLYANRSYGYDGVGNVKNIRDSVRPEANRDLDYDAIDRLVVANGSWGAGSIAYDGNGNITSQTFGSYKLNYVYDAASQKLSSTSGAQTGSYQYDVYGNITKRGTGQSYSYDDAGNMAFINKGAANAVAYTYDAKGWRVRSLGPNLDSQQVHIGNNLVSEYDNIKKGWLDHLYLGNQKVADWTWDKDGTQKLEFFHADPAGSPMLATDTAGVVLWAANYYPYGYKLAGGGAGEKNKQWFGGKPQDDESGLQYFGARYYDPVIGRFMAMDPVDWQESNPFHSFNSYAYANNNPWRYVDPDGRVPVDTIWDVANVIYDLGKIAVGAVTGNSAMVASGTVDLAADLVATAIPYVPAGASKVVGGLNKVPNPFGKAGGPQHRAKVKEIVDDIESRGLVAGQEHLVRTPSGNKSRRFVDVVARDKKGDVVEMHQVGRQTKGGNPVSREVKALDDIQGASNVRPQYHPYN
ncbi:RHS repeat domain-containing protein [Iodobacter ciconiae]|uniref:RHS repeat domain-containing protein n=1 Tax=Iodobacter ciconiae TaxID=2496266 RepID=UPI0013DEE797|nr:RHS repeat-associated core domain-containing protein [Iodobacter ciconiae]